MQNTATNLIFIHYKKQFHENKFDTSRSILICLKKNSYVIQLGHDILKLFLKLTKNYFIIIKDSWKHIKSNRPKKNLDLKKNNIQILTKAARGFRLLIFAPLARYFNH